MKRIKIMIMIALVFVVTGCSATYEVEIYNNQIREKIDLVDPNATTADENTNNVYTIVDRNVGIDSLYRGFATYENSKKNYFALRAETKFDFKSYKDELLTINTCCRSIDFSDNGKFITFRTLGYFNWFDKYEDLDELNIVIKSNHKVKEHNADKVGRYTYTWHITKDNYKEKIPSIKLYSNKYVFDYDGSFVKKVLTIVGIIAIISLIGFITYKYFTKRSNKVNEI